MLHDVGVDPVRSIDIERVLVLMSAWRAGEVLQVDSISRFPLLEMAPDAAEYFTKSAHLSARDLRFLVTELAYPVDWRDEPAVYGEILKRAEDAPWIFPVLEVLVAENRSGQRGGKSHGKLGHVLSKLPLTKLGLKSRLDLHGRLLELGHSPAPVDVAVAAFCEFAILSYDERVKADGLADVSRRAVELLKHRPGVDINTAVEPADDAGQLIAFGDSSEFLPSAGLKQQVIEAIRRLSSSLDMNSETSHFTVIAGLAHLGEKIVDAMPAQRNEALVEHLVSMGVASSPQSFSSAGLNAFGGLLNCGLSETMEKLDTEAEAIEARILELREEIKVATQDEDFTTVGLLAPQASAAKSDLAEIAVSKQQMIELLAELVSEDCKNVEVVARLLRARSNQSVDSETLDASADVAEGPSSFASSVEPPSHPRDAIEMVLEIPEEEPEKHDALDSQRQDDVSVLPPLETKASQSIESAASLDAYDLAPTQELEHAAVSNEILASLLERDLIGIAFDTADAAEESAVACGLSAVALRVAAASRLARLEYEGDTTRFETIVDRAIAQNLDDLSSVLVMGALVRPAILAAKLRNRLQGLPRGVLGQHLLQVGEAIAHLEYAFPPSADVLAEMSGSQKVPQRQRYVDLLDAWRTGFVRKTSRWPFATAFMHEVASDDGVIGRAIGAVKSGDSRAASLARAAIDELSSASQIDAHSISFATVTGRSVARLHAKGIDYLYRQFEEPRSLLRGWLAAVESERSRDQLSDARVRSAVGNLQSRLDRAIQGLLLEEQGEFDGLTKAVSAWIRVQLNEACKALDGGDSGSFATLDEALLAERDLLPAAARDAVESGEDRFGHLISALNEGAVLVPKQALFRACEEAEFDTAYRLSDRFKIDEGSFIRERISTFTSGLIEKIEHRRGRLKSIAKVDYKHQDDLLRQIEWCTIALHRLVATSTGEEVHDLADIPRQISGLDAFIDRISTSIRGDQKARISEYRNDQNRDEADKLEVDLEQLTIEAVEDRIAQLRDGRSAASFETDLSGVIREFVPDFLAFSASPEWPKSQTAFGEQISRPGPLFVDEDRRPAALAFVKAYRDIVSGLTARAPIGSVIKHLFEEINFENVKLHDLRPVGRTALWHGTLSGVVRDAGNDGLFIPPAFGSQATGGYHLVLAGLDVLPEAIVSQLSHDRPVLLVMAGVVDHARRQELAERLRANAISCLLIDEALVTFAATRRYTRLRSIFECGLPYGRVDPYTTDAGALPPEMFFGREQEILQIMSKTADGCLVYGGRQLGKSALLGHVERTENDPANDRHVVRRDVKSLGNSEKTSEVWTHLSLMLPDVVQSTSRTADAVKADIHRWLQLKPRGRIVCMFDEADNFMDADTRADYPELTKLKELMEDSGRAFKVVFAGLHNVQRMYRQPNSPLAHLGTPICIGPLNRTEDDKRSAHNLVVQPMRAAGFRFETHEAVEEILSWANYYPSLVQEYMKGLLSTLHGSGSGRAYRLPAGNPLWPIETSTLFAHRGFQHIESRVREKFHLTLNLDPRYALVAFTLGRLNAEGREHEARVVGFSSEELLEESNYYWPKASQAASLPAFNSLLEELFDLGVLGRVPIPNTTRFRYLLGSRQVASMLGSPGDIYHALEDIELRDPTVAYDRSIHRRRYTPSRSNKEHAYSPLTDLQIERILRQEANSIQIVCGVELLGLAKVGSSLARISELGQLPGAPNENLVARSVTTVKELRSLVEAAKPRASFSTLIVFTPHDAKTASDAIRWAEQQSAVLEGRIRLLVVLDAGDQDKRAIASRRHDQTEYLTAWGGEMVRVHLHNIEELGLDTPSLRAAILEAAGGMPLETTKLVEVMRVADNPIEVAQTWRAEGQILPASVTESALGKALSVIEMSDDGDAAAFNELMKEHTGADVVDIGPDLLATGLVSTWNRTTGSMRMSALGHWLRQRLDS